MSFKLDTKKFKKIGGDAQKTVMKHEDGHELTIAHKGLSPKMRAALVEMPMATKAGEDHKASSQKTSANKGEIKMADGGRVSNADQRQSIVDAYNGKKGQPQGQAGNGQVWGSGDYLQVAPPAPAQYVASQPRQIPNNNMPVATPERPMGEDVGYNKAELAAMSPDQRAIAIQSMQQNQLAQANQAAMVRNPAGAQAAADAQAGNAGTLAQQQAAMLANPPAPQANPQMPAYAKGGAVKPQHFDDGGMPDFNQNSTPAAPPQEAMPAPAPQEDPSLAAKRSVYNQIVNGDAGPVPSAPNANPDGSFGPNGEAPKNFNADAWKAAEAKFQADQARTVSSQQQASAQVVEDNKARMAAGLPPMPVPAAPALPQNPMQVPAGAASTPGGASQSGLGAAPSQPGDPFGTNAYEQNYMKGIGEQKAGMAGEARALAQQGNSEAAMLQNNVILQQQNQKTYQDHYNELDKERQAFQQDIANSHIDPKHYMNSLGAAGRISTTIGLIIGGFGGGGSDNAAFNYLKDNINRDIDAQKVELGKKENLLSANMKQFDNLRDATNMTRVMQNDIVSNQLKAAAAKAQDPLAKARALQAAGKLDAESAPVLAQIAMKKSLLGGMQAGQISPEKVVNFIVPEGQRAAANKELESATTLGKARDNLLSAFDQSVPLVTAGHRMGNPIQAQRQVDAIQGPVIEQLAKDNEGRVTPTTVQYLKGLMPSMGDNAETAALKRQKLNDFASAKMQSTQFPILKSYGIDMTKQGRFSPQGASRIPEAAPVLKRK